DVDEVDPAAVGVRRRAAGDLHERRDGVRAVGQEDVAVRREDPEREDDNGEQEQSEPAEARGAEPPHSRKRVRPPSTGMVAPVTYAAWSEARKQTTFAISLGVPRRRSGIGARSCSD